MQNRPRRRNGSRPDRRRLHVQVRPRGETETERGCPGSGGPPGAGADMDRDGGAGLQPPWLNAGPERRRWAHLTGKQRSSLPPPGSRGSGMAPSWLPWALAARFHLPWKQHGFRRRAAVPACSRRSGGRSIARYTAWWATSIYIKAGKLENALLNKTCSIKNILKTYSHNITVN